MPLLPAAIGIILNENQSQILLVKRCDVPVWVLPGGGVEAHETFEEGLTREIFEETGYQIRILRQSAEYTPINRLAALTKVFLCQIQSGESCLSSETSDIAFHRLSQLPSSLFPPHHCWIIEALSSSTLIQRPLTEISYLNLLKYFILHPWLVLRYAWTRFTKL